MVPKRSRRPARAPRLSQAKLAILVEEAIVDAYNDIEQATGLFTMIEDHLALPFETAILGASVLVERVEINDGSAIVAICRRGRERQKIPILDLPLPSPAPKGYEWIAAYRFWARGR
ncbi:MAG TPA: calcium-binding protein [Candidatus Dormibacteraeota bacterium]|nr:calcium-binding protein [Candidatus Dormibacteraeota bacterium]